MSNLLLSDSNQLGPMKKNKFDVAVISPVRFESDPRHTWWLESFRKNGYRSCFIESASEKAYVFDRQTKKFQDLEIRIRKLDDFDGISTLVSQEFAMSRFVKCKDSDLKKMLETLICNSITLPSIHSVNQIIRIMAGLDNAREFIESKIVVANDLVTAVASLLIYEKDTVIIYDAQEIFTDMWDSSTYGSLSSQERLLWLELESQVCQKVNKVVTVSPGISILYKERHKIDAFVIPNFVPKESFTIEYKKDPQVNFVFMGGLAPNRGIFTLVENWSNLKIKNITLDLYIPISRNYMKLKKQIKNLNDRNSSNIRLLKAVDESEMISTLSKYDVGIIPYAYPYPYNHCSPNKLGQYISQELAILSNHQPFISNVISEFNIGEALDMADRKSFFQSVLYLADRKKVNEFRANSKKSYQTKLNWDYFFNKFLNSDRLIFGIEKVQTDAENFFDLGANKITYLQFSSKKFSFKKFSFILIEYSGVYANSPFRFLLHQFLDSNLMRKISAKFRQKYI